MEVVIAMGEMAAPVPYAYGLIIQAWTEDTHSGASHHASIVIFYN
jgi:hypothetical protein